MSEQIPTQKDMETPGNDICQADKDLLAKCTIQALKDHEDAFTPDSKVKPFAKKILARMQGYDNTWRDLTHDKCKKGNRRWDMIYKKVHHLFRDTDKLNKIYKKFEGDYPLSFLVTEASSVLQHDQTL